MWQRVTIQLPTELARVTTAVWQYAELMQIGVMRECMLGPPCLWATQLGTSYAKLRNISHIVSEFQQLIHSPLVYAETDVTKSRHEALLLFAGFTKIDSGATRALYQRSI